MSRISNRRSHISARIAARGVFRPDFVRTTLDAVLRPDTLVGRLVDQGSGEPIANATVIATTTFPGTDVAFTDPSFVPVRVRLDDYTLVNLNAQ
ncbi:MAG: hypothetical protein HC817_08015, partial [Saprospiraceae bacterium]|nr:hypothetical protein [Saprospiraceae bacterium]